MEFLRETYANQQPKLCLISVAMSSESIFSTFSLLHWNKSRWLKIFFLRFPGNSVWRKFVWNVGCDILGIQEYCTVDCMCIRLTLVLLNPDIPCLCKRCRSRSVGFCSWSGSESALFAIKYMNLLQQLESSNLIGWKLEEGVASIYSAGQGLIPYACGYVQRSKQEVTKVVSLVKKYWKIYQAFPVPQKVNWYIFRGGTITWLCKIAFILFWKGWNIEVKNLLLPGQGANSFLLEKTTFQKIWCTAKQTGSHKSCLPCSKWQKIYQVYSVPLRHCHNIIYKIFNNSGKLVPDSLGDMCKCWKFILGVSVQNLRHWTPMVPSYLKRPIWSHLTQTDDSETYLVSSNVSIHI